MMTGIIIDDEKDSREMLSGTLAEKFPDLNLVGEADGVASGIDLISKASPDLVFLDVEMADGTGFDLLKKLDPVAFKVIFISAHQEYAIQAFRFSAVDYLLKPVDPELLAEAVQKASQESDQSQELLKLKVLLENIDTGPKKENKLVLKTSDNIYVINTQDIIRCESEGNYTEFHLTNERRIVISKLIKEYDNLLSPAGFFRTHQSHLINLEHFDRYHKKDGGFVVMKDGSSVPLSFRKKDLLLSRIQES